jgi:uncharacterized Zn-finger protein
MTEEIIETKNTVVKCNGGGGVLGHPIVFLNLDPQGMRMCPYCSKCFVKIYSSKGGAKTKALRRAS